MQIEMESKRKMEIEKESDKRRKVMEGEIEAERFLFVGSGYHLLCIDLNKTEVVWITNIHATSGYLPFGMSPTRFDFNSASGSRVLIPCSTSSSSGSNILLIGGEWQNPSSPYCSSHTSREIYKICPEVANGDLKDIKIECADAYIPRMQSGKACPIIEEIVGNLFVLHTRFINGGFREQPEIAFEVFDSKICQWRTLPTPPFFTAQSDTVIYAHAVIEHLFAIETSKECFSFDTTSKQWSCLDNMTSFLINRLPMTVPSGLPCFGFDGQGRPLYIGVSLTIEPAAYLVSPDGTILAAQSLRDIKPQKIKHLPIHTSSYITCDKTIIALTNDVIQ